MISSSQRPLPAEHTTNTTDKHPRPQRDSTIPAIEWPHTYTSDRTATGIGRSHLKYAYLWVQALHNVTQGIANLGNSRFKEMSKHEIRYAMGLYSMQRNVKTIIYGTVTHHIILLIARLYLLTRRDSCRLGTHRNRFKWQPSSWSCGIWYVLGSKRAMCSSSTREVTETFCKVSITFHFRPRMPEHLLNKAGSLHYRRSLLLTLTQAYDNLHVRFTASHSRDSRALLWGSALNLFRSLARHLVTATV